MSTRWYTSRDGVQRTTMRVDYRIPREMIDWMQAQVGWTEAACLRFVRRNIGDLTDQWHTLAQSEYDREIHDLSVVHHDDVGGDADTVYYEGEPAV